MFLVGHRTHSAAVAASFAAAGATYFELDARVVADRVVVTHYRPVLWSRGLLERDNARLRRLRTPTVDLVAEDVIQGLPDGARIVFDPKDREPELRVQLVDKLVRAVDDPGRHVVSTRSLRDIEMFGRAGFCTWWTIDTPEQIREVSRRPLPADGVTVRQRSLTAERVHLLHTVTDTVVAWTARSVASARRLAAFGVDGITTHSLSVMAAIPV